MTVTEVAKPSLFHYDKPVVGEKKITIPLGRTDRGGLFIQVFASGGENNLHAHPHSDGFWFVLKGAARFYTVDDRLIAEVGEDQGILMPRGYPYWFEYVDNGNHDDLEIIRFSTNDFAGPGTGSERVNYEPVKAGQSDDYHANTKAENLFEKA